MIVSKTNNGQKNCGERILDASATEVALDKMLRKAFDPASFPMERLHTGETARFIAEQARKLRLAAIGARQPVLIKLSEALYYEAYSLAFAKLERFGNEKVLRSAGH